MKKILMLCGIGRSGHGSDFARLSANRRPAAVRRRTRRCQRYHEPPRGHCSDRIGSRLLAELTLPSNRLTEW